MAGNVEFACRVPNEQTPRLRSTFRTIFERMERQSLLVAQMLDAAQTENIIGHGDIVKDILLVKVQPAPHKFDTLPLESHEDAIDKRSICLAIREFLFISRCIIGRIDRDIAWRQPKNGSKFLCIHI